MDDSNLKLAEYKPVEPLKPVEVWTDLRSWSLGITFSVLPGRFFLQFLCFHLGINW